MAKDNKLAIILKEQNIEGNQAKELMDAFGLPLDEAGEVLAKYESIKVTDESQTDIMQLARENRLILKRTRTGVENKRKELKADIVKTGRAIDAVATFVKEIIEPAEAYLQLQEDFAEIKQAERAAQRKAERTAKLLQYTDDISMFNLDEMDDVAFYRTLDMLKGIKEREIAEAKIAEEKRIADEKAKAEEEAKIRAENERLRAEAEAKEREREAERQAEADRIALINAENEARIAEERQKAQAAEAEAAKLKEAEALRLAQKAKEELEAANHAKAAETAPDKAKLLQFAAILSNLPYPTLTDDVATGIIEKAGDHINKVIDYIEERAEQL